MANGGIPWHPGFNSYPHINADVIRMPIPSGDADMSQEARAAREQIVRAEKVAVAGAPVRVAPIVISRATAQEVRVRVYTMMASFVCLISGAIMVALR